jgi:hypothetical protein
VLTTHRTSLPEVGGEAVAYTEPDAESIKVALGALLDDPERRAALGAAGHVRAQEFTWAASAAAHLASYKRAADQSAGERAGLGYEDPGLWLSRQDRISSVPAATDGRMSMLR